METRDSTIKKERGERRMKRKQKRYEPGFKIKVVKEYLNTEISQGELSKKYDVPEGTISDWKVKYEQEGEKVFKKKREKKKSIVVDRSKVPPVLAEELGLKEEEDDSEKVRELKEELAKERLKNQILEDLVKKKDQT
jgi:transposase-like protein